MIPVNEPKLNGNELKYVSDCITAGWISSYGDYLERFESGWAEYCGQKYGIGVCNGTAALELAVKVCNFPEGSEIILPSFTIISCAQAVVKNGCVPVLVDCDPKTYCIDVSQIEEKVTDRTVAIMPVHIYGHPCDMDPILKIAKKHNLVVIEDAAEAHGAEYKGKKCGSFGQLSCFSFYANKIITTGEGGMVLTSNKTAAERLRSYRNLCFLKSPRFLHNEMGYNYRLTNMQAAIGLAQIQRIDKIIKDKIDIAKKYSEYLKNFPLKLPIENNDVKNVFWMYGVLLIEGPKTKKYFDGNWISKSPKFHVSWPSYKIINKLEKSGIETRPFFIGIHEQPVFRKMGLFKKESCPITEKIARIGFYIPSGLGIKNTEIKQVVNAFKNLFL